MIVKRAWNVFINKDHELYEWCADMTSKANNLSNAIPVSDRSFLHATKMLPTFLIMKRRSLMRLMLF